MFTAAIEKLRTGRKPVDDFKNLCQEVNELRKSNESLGKELDDLKKRLEASYPEKPVKGKKKSD